MKETNQPNQPERSGTIFLTGENISRLRDDIAHIRLYTEIALADVTDAQGAYKTENVRAALLSTAQACVAARRLANKVTHLLDNLVGTMQ